MVASKKISSRVLLSKDHEQANRSESFKSDMYAVVVRVRGWNCIDISQCCHCCYFPYWCFCPL